MKVLSVRQPWAEYIMSGAKDVENRSWCTSYRGLLVIHAGVFDPGPEFGHLPRGVALGVVTLVSVGRDVPSRWAEPGAWHWLLADPRSFPEPIPMRGQRGLYEPPEEVMGAIAELLSRQPKSG